MQILVNGYSVSEHLKLRRIDEEVAITNIRELDRVIGHIRRNKKQYLRLVYLIAVGFNVFGCPVFAAPGYDPITLDFFGYIVNAVKAIMLLGLPVELIKCVAGGTVEQIGRISIKYVALGLVIRFLPDIVAKILP